ncbi:MAG TPA: archease [Candidatus Thermoplasmatota archaeon]|nr:archease [Candidatus Thermoplasmatota archaeon]
MARSVRGYEFVEHTADLGVRAWAPSLAEAFAEAARGMVDYILDDAGTVTLHDFRVVEIKAGSAERALVEFLDELNFLILTEGFIFREVRVKRFDPEAGVVEAEAWGEFLDEERHGHVHEIKAITFHDLVVTRDPPEVYVIFDI